MHKPYNIFIISMFLAHLCLVEEHSFLEEGDFYTGWVRGCLATGVKCRDRVPGTTNGFLWSQNHHLGSSRELGVEEGIAGKENPLEEGEE